MAEHGYRTIFRPGDEGVAIHKKGTLTITTSEPPVLQGCKKRGAKLWTVAAAATEREEVANVHDIPPIGQSIKYLHAAAGFPVEDTWVNAINTGNYTIWLGLTAKSVRKHFPELDKSQKGHMKRQQQGVHLIRTLLTPTMEDDKQVAPTSKTSPAPKPKKMQDLYNTNQPGQNPATSSCGNQYIILLVKVDGNYIDAEPIKTGQED